MARAGGGTSDCDMNVSARKYGDLELIPLDSRDGHRHDNSIDSLLSAGRPVAWIVR